MTDLVAVAGFGVAGRQPVSHWIASMRARARNRDLSSIRTGAMLAFATLVSDDYTRARQGVKEAMS